VTKLPNSTEIDNMNVVIKIDRLFLEIFLLKY